MTSPPWTPPACSRASTSAGGSPTRATSDGGSSPPPRKPAGKQLSDTAKKVSRSINRVRYIVEQVNAHIKAWKILKEDYRRPLDTFPQTITATLMLYTYTTTP